MSEQIIQTVGTITKKELISSVENEMYTNKFVVENQEPYPGYHGTTVKKALSYDFDGAAGTITYQNKGYTCVRIKQLPYRKVGEVLEQFEKCNIEFRKNRKVAPFQSMIRVRKFFSVKRTVDGVYEDADDKNVNYLELPLLLRWPTFEKITLNMKYNMDDHNWDAAQTSMFYKDGLMDFVRIFDEDSCQGKLLHIRERYLEAIAKL